MRDNGFSKAAPSGNTLLEEVLDRECFCGVCSGCLGKDDELGIWVNEGEDDD